MQLRLGVQQAGLDIAWSIDRTPRRLLSGRGRGGRGRGSRGVGKKVTPRPVVIDTDPGIDDALALMLALRAPEIHVELLTTVAGNVPVDVATANACRLVALLNPSSWPWWPGGGPSSTPAAVHGHCHPRPRRSGRADAAAAGRWQSAVPPQRPTAQRQAVQRLLTLVETYRQDLTVIALGPLTNIARCHRARPETMQQLGRLIIMGGAIAVPGNVTAVAEFNILLIPMPRTSSSELGCR